MSHSTRLSRPAPVLLAVLAAILLQAGCTTVQTTYFRGSFQPLDPAGHPAYQPYSGETRFRQTGDMAVAAEDMYSQGYGMVGYSQFVSPLLPSLAPGYATKYAESLQAEYAVMEVPRPGASNLHGYLVTYWSRLRPEVMGMGAYATELPESLLQRLGSEYNVVYLRGIIPGTAAAAAGLERDDVVLAIDGLRIESLRAYGDMIRKGYGDEVLVSVSRRGELVDVPVDLSGVTPIRDGIPYRETPWRNTVPRDWSMLSAANITADVVRQQQQERARQEAYERGRREALAASATLDSDYNAAYSRFMSERELRTSGQRRSYTRADRLAGLPPPSPSEWNMQYGSFLDKFKGLSGNPNELNSLDIWFSHAPNIYGQLFTFPRPQVY